MVREYTYDGDAGCVWRSRPLETGGRIVVGIYRNDQAGLDEGEDGSLPWSTVCEEHSHIVSHPTLDLARSHAANPLGWCEACMVAEVADR